MLCSADWAQAAAGTRGLAQGHVAGGGSKGLSSPDSALAAPQHSPAQTGQSACPAEVLVYRNEFLLMNKSQKPALERWWGTAGHSCRVGSHRPQARLPGHHWDGYRAGGGAGAGFTSPPPSSMVWRGLSDPWMPLQSNTDRCACGGWDPQSWGLTQRAASGKPLPHPSALIRKMEMIIPATGSSCEGPALGVGSEAQGEEDENR